MKWYAPPGRVPRLQVTDVVPEQVPWVDVAETNWTPLGSVSTTVTSVRVV